jgi:hypothetical protein
MNSALMWLHLNRRLSLALTSWVEWRLRPALRTARGIAEYQTQARWHEAQDERQ